jgi:hypothetical protein
MSEWRKTLTIKYYPMFHHPKFGSVGKHLCESCARNRMISEPSTLTKCDECGKEELLWENLLKDVMFAGHNKEEK